MRKILFFVLFLTACTPYIKDEPLIRVICDNQKETVEKITERVKDLDGHTLDDTATANFIADELAFEKGGQWVCTVAK